MLRQSYCISLQDFFLFQNNLRGQLNQSGPAAVIQPPTARSKQDSLDLELLVTAHHAHHCIRHGRDAADGLNKLRRHLIQWTVLYHFYTECTYQQALRRKMTEVCQFGKLIKLHKRISTMNTQQGKSLEISCCITQVLQIFE